MTVHLRGLKKRRLSGRLHRRIRHEVLVQCVAIRTITTKLQGDSNAVAALAELNDTQILPVDRDSSVDIATAYGLGGPGIESRWGEILRTSPDRP